MAMSDNMRDSIAAAMKPLFLEDMRFPDEGYAHGRAQRYADAVIEALGEAGYAIVNRSETQAAISRLIAEHSR